MTRLPAFSCACLRRQEVQHHGRDERAREEIAGEHGEDDGHRQRSEQRPADTAQEVTDRLVHAGVKAILNFAPIQLTVPSDVVVKSVNMALELETLSFSLSNR